MAGQSFRHGGPLTTTPEAISSEAIPSEAIPSGAIPAEAIPTEAIPAYQSRRTDPGRGGNAHFADNPCLFTGKMVYLRPHNFRAG